MTDRWMLHVDDADIDAAYDTAVAAAADLDGAGHPLLAVTPDEMTAVDTVRTLAGARRIAAGIDDVCAVPYSADRYWARRRINIRVDDPDLELGVDGTHLDARTLHVDDELLARLLTIGDATIGDGEVVDLVELLRVRSRYKTVATRGEGRSQNRYVARSADGVVLGAGPTASAARREAVAAMKEPLDGHERYSVEVYKEVRRDSGPHYLLERVRVAQRGAVRIHVAAEKDPAKTKITGWLFSGPPAS
jgi:hypothetical protein